MTLTLMLQSVIKSAVAGCVLAVTAAGAATAEMPPPEGLRSAAAAGGPALPCLIEPHQTIKLATPVAALVDAVMVDRGSVVTKGQPVAHLSSAVEEAEVAQNRIRAADQSAIRQKEARRDFTEGKRARLERLRGTSQFVAPTTYEEADADARQARADLEAAIVQARLAQVELIRATAKLDERTIRAPVDGVVIEKNMSVGEYVYDQAHILTLAEMDPLSVETYMPVARYGSVVLNAKARVRPEAPIGGEYEAVVTVVDSVFDSRSGTFGIRLTLPNPGNLLPANIRCEVVFPDVALSRVGH